MRSTSAHYIIGNQSSPIRNGVFKALMDHQCSVPCSNDLGNNGWGKNDDSSPHLEITVEAGSTESITATDAGF